MSNLPFMFFLQTAVRPMLVLAVVLCLTCAHADMYDDVERMINHGQLQRAQTRSNEHLQLHPIDPQMRLLSSRVLDGLGQSDAAVAVLESLRTEFPELPEPHNNLAAIYARSGRTQEALESLHRALLARPDDPIALENLGDLHLHLALQAYQRIAHSTSTTVTSEAKMQALFPLLGR